MDGGLTSEFMAQLVDLGVTGMFIGYLVWSNKMQAKKLDEFVSKMFDTMQEMERDRKGEHEQIRDRYEAVISGLRQEMNDLRTRYDGVITQYNSERETLLHNISSKLDEGLSEMRKNWDEQRLERLRGRGA